MSVLRYEFPVGGGKRLSAKRMKITRHPELITQDSCKVEGLNYDNQIAR